MKNKTQKALTGIPFFLFFTPLFFIHHSYNELFGFIPALLVVKQTAYLFVFTLILYVIFIALIKNKKRAALTSFWILIFILFFGLIHDSIKQLGIHAIFSRYSSVLTLLFLTFIAVIFLSYKNREKDCSRSYKFLNILFTILLLVECIASLRLYQDFRQTHNLLDPRFKVLNEYNTAIHPKIHEKPDIFLLVFDAMSSSKSLQNTFQKDNSSLDSFLLKKGFYVVKNSKSNYNWTVHSVSATLNMDYLPEDNTFEINDPINYFYGSKSILDNSLTRILKKESYKVLQYQPVSFNNSDFPYETFFESMLTNHFFFKTLPGRIYRDLFWNISKINVDFLTNYYEDLFNERNIRRKSEIDNITGLIKSSCDDTSKPKFVYGHYMIPHDPYTFDSSGNIKTGKQNLKISMTEKDEEDLYFEQVKYANKIIIDLVDYIKTKNRKKTILIVLGDHGYKYYKSDQVNEVFHNLNAIYFPDKNYSKLYDSLSNINIFRIILNKEFGSSLNMLKDSSVYVAERE